MDRERWKDDLGQGQRSMRLKRVGVFRGGGGVGVGLGGHQWLNSQDENVLL